MSKIRPITKEMSCLGAKSPLKSFVKMSNFQPVMFAIISVTMNEHICKLFKNIFNNV